MVAATRRRARPIPPRRLSFAGSVLFRTANYKIFAWLTELCKLVVRALSDPLSYTPLIILFCFVAVALRGTQELPTATALHIAGGSVVLCLVVEATIRCLMRRPFDGALGHSISLKDSDKSRARVRRQPNHLRSIDKRRKLARTAARRRVVRRRRQTSPLHDHNTRRKFSWRHFIVLVFTFSMKEETRSALFRAAAHWMYTAFRRKKQTHNSTARIFSMIWGALPTEKNSFIRQSILTYEDYNGHKSRVKDGSLIVARALHKAFRNETLCTSDERRSALHILGNCDGSDEFDSLDEFLEYAPAIKHEIAPCSLAVCLMLIEHHKEKERLPDNEIVDIVELMRHLTFDGEYESIAAIVEHPYAMPFLLYRLSAYADPWSDLSDIVWWIVGNNLTEDAEKRRTNWITAIVRFYPMLQNAFACLSIADIFNLMRMEHLASTHFMSPKLIKRVAGMIAQPFTPVRYFPPFPEGYELIPARELQRSHSIEQAHEIACRLLEAALPDDAALQNMLGYGLLSIARHISRLDDRHRRRGPYPTAHIVFNSILRQHPEWRAKFKLWTQDGAQGNAIADQGRQLVLRNRNHAVYEIL